MGGSPATKQSSSFSESNPYAPAQGLLDSLLAKSGGVNSDLTGAENSALQALSGNASAGNQFAPAITGLANTLLGGGGPDRSGMINDAYLQYQKSLASTAAGDYVNPASNPALQGYLSTIANDVSGRVNGMFAHAGRDLSGMNLQSLARGITEGQAPVLVDAYNRARGDQLAAQDKLFGAGGQTAGLLSNLDQTRLGNQQAGITAADAANTAQNWGPMQNSPNRGAAPRHPAADADAADGFGDAGGAGLRQQDQHGRGDRDPGLEPPANRGWHRDDGGDGVLASSVGRVPRKSGLHPQQVTDIRAETGMAGEDGRERPDVLDGLCRQRPDGKNAVLQFSGGKDFDRVDVFGAAVARPDHGDICRDRRDVSALGASH